MKLVNSADFFGSNIQKWLRLHQDKIMTKMLEKPIQIKHRILCTCPFYFCVTVQGSE